MRFKEFFRDFWALFILSGVLLAAFIYRILK